MRTKLRKILVTGGAGFIGSAFCRLALERGYRVVVVDRLTYAADLKRLGRDLARIAFYKLDICRQSALEAVFKKERPAAVVNFAAQTHVDRSIKDPAAFAETNFRGAETVFSLSREYGVERLVQISTDEVYGPVLKGSCREDALLNPSSPYSAAKAGADLLLQAYNRTYGFPGMIVRPSNTYGPWQYPEKLIPLSVLKIMRNEKVPVYGRGKNFREWLYLDDCVRGIMAVLEKGREQEVYNLGSGEERRNLEVVKALLGLLKVKGAGFEFIPDRPGHDRRYFLDSRKVRKETGWRPRISFEKGLSLTAGWCRENRGWLFGKWPSISPLYK